MRGRVDAEAQAQVAVQDAQDVLEALARDRRGHGGERQVRRGERHAQPAAGEHHHDARRSGALGEVLGVAGERDAGVVDRRLLHRRRDHRGELARLAAVEGAIEQRQDVPRRWPGRGDRRRPAPARRRAARTTARRRRARSREGRRRRPRCRARAAMTPRSPTNTSLAAKRLPARIAHRSGPMPAGSPAVIAMTGAGAHARRGRRERGPQRSSRRISTKARSRVWRSQSW